MCIMTVRAVPVDDASWVTDPLDPVAVTPRLMIA